MEKLLEENGYLKEKIKDLINMEERYKEFLKMDEMMIQRLKEENDTLRNKINELEKEISFKTNAIIKEHNRKKDIDNYDRFMISFKNTGLT